MAQMQDAADEARQKAHEVGGKARGRAREQVDQRSTEAGQRVSTTAGDIRSVSDELRKQGKDGPAKVADQVADRAERVGGYLQEADSDRILHDIEEAGRRQPWAVVAGGIALGFAASRFLKASSRDRYQSRTRNGGSNGPGRSGQWVEGQARPTAGPYTEAPNPAATPVEPPAGGIAPSRA
jgi:hypothetical protein